MRMCLAIHAVRITSISIILAKILEEESSHLLLGHFQIVFMLAVGSKDSYMEL